MGKRILVCEDEAHIAQLIEKSLETMGHVVDVAFTADQAVDLYRAATALQRSYDLVITDVDMPNHSGLYFASHVRAQGFIGRVIVLTNLSWDTISHSVISVNGEYYLKSNEITNLREIVDGPSVAKGRRATDNLPRDVSMDGIEPSN